MRVERGLDPGDRRARRHGRQRRSDVGRSIDHTARTHDERDTSRADDPAGAAAVDGAITGAVDDSDVAGEVDVKVYFLSGERLAIAHRLVAGPELLRQAIGELLAGPTLDERSTGLLSTVPPETELLDVNLADGVATIDLSSAYASGGGTLSMMARLAQVVFTATQFDTVDGVAFRLDGEPIETLGGEGLMLDGPQARMDIDRSISGDVIIDTPVVGATVTSPFTVTGEGNVFEAQFPIEVWAGGWGIGELIGGIAPVTAGAWGDWSDFEVTITLDAPAGPIELVAYDEGGCGTGPDCPEIIRTVVPLIFTG